MEPLNNPFESPQMEDNSSCYNMDALAKGLDQIYIKRRDIRRSKPRPPAGKWWWASPDGWYIAAGGIIIRDICDDKEGIWVLIEKSRRGYGQEYTDIGGKYDWNDGDIYATISREFREELYNTDEIPYKTIKRLCEQFKSYDKNNQLFMMRKGKYMCLIVDRSVLPNLELDSKQVENARSNVLSRNHFCRDEMYRTISLRFLPFDEVVDHKNLLSYRLSNILKDSALRNKIPGIEKLNTVRECSQSNGNWRSQSKRHDGQLP